ncbi:hypothetical protein NPIL_583391 [Nephila pilipes]|uniref:Uncharacterized protein n=1 Tax=Nephila pilipes TaxID=299642 RepID=A0A8X6Q854_NEPPI|nr:hypothetical protein NPIL_583391 [Nephila pilipes]
MAHTSIPPPKNAQISRMKFKATLIAFFDVHYEFVPLGQTVEGTCSLLGSAEKIEVKRQPSEAWHCRQSVASSWQCTFYTYFVVNNYVTSNGIVILFQPSPPLQYRFGCG